MREDVSVKRLEACMAKRKARDRGKEAFWRGALRQQASSGLTIRAYCREHRLGESLFFFWRRELARRKSLHKQRPFVPVRVREESGAKNPGHNGGSQANRIGCLEIACDGGYRVLVSGPVDRQALRDVLAVLEGLSC
jgi:transposase-like protein